MSGKVTINGACHCGTVSFTALVEKEVKTLLCNCSMCAACGFEHLIVPHQDFSLISGKENLTEYRFGTKTAAHWFCKTCGVKSFYQPRSHPDCFSVNLNCIENTDELIIVRELFDGLNWEKSKAALSE